MKPRKAYASSLQGPDTLGAGKMVTVNHTIDLMEKENFGPAEVRRRSEELVRAAGTPQVK